MPAGKRRSFTWSDYLAWPEGERWELIGGEAVDMSPSPSSRHQWTSARLAGILERFFKGRGCRLWIAPMAVRLSDEDVVEPDLFVICDSRQIHATHIAGPPALAIEILSERTQRHDRITKMALYARFGLREYWIVNPFPPLVEVFILDGGQYRLHGGYEAHEILRSPSFPALRVKLAGVFNFPLEPGEKALLTVRESRAPYGGRSRRRPADASRIRHERS